jgi:hypothetical protein
MIENKKLLALQYLLQYLVMRGIEKAGQVTARLKFFYFFLQISLDLARNAYYNDRQKGGDNVKAKDVIEILIGLWANIIATASFIVAVKKQKNTATENPHNKKR